MSETAPTPLRETVLRQCLAADPNPWYPKDYAAAAGMHRESLYGPLNDLRVANLVQLTEWVQGKGQGYVITALGREALHDPLFLAQLRDGKPPAPAAAPAAESAGPSRVSNRFERGEAARRAFYLPGAARVVPALILLNVLVFVVSVAMAAREGKGIGRFLGGGDAEVMHKVGALSMPDLARGEWWRLLTNCFLHFGVAHLTVNMISLALLWRVESLWGTGRFLALYVICAVCGSIAGIVVSPGEVAHPIYLAGASGALWGVMASAAVWLVLNRSHLAPRDFRGWLQGLFFTLVLNTGVSMLPNVSAAAHFGGAIVGAVAALLLQVHRYGPPARKAVAGIQLALLPGLFLLGLSLAMERDSRLQPFMTAAYRAQITERLAKLPPALDSLEPQADKLHLQESAKRDMANLKTVRDGLEGLMTQAKEARDWVMNSAPVEPARPLKETALAMLDALIPYAEALNKQAGGETVPNINDLRAAWRDAKAAWTAATAK